MINYDKYMFEYTRHMIRLRARLSRKEREHSLSMFKSTILFIKSSYSNSYKIRYWLYNYAIDMFLYNREVTHETDSIQ